MNRILAGSALAAAACLAGAAAQAHTLGEAGTGFAHGFAHPLAGLDHLLAMVAVGIWAAQLGGRAFWAVPASFVAMMAAGAAAGWAGVPVPGVESAIAVSLLVLGVAVVTAARLPAAAGAALVGAFALFHGHAHGAELPAASALATGAGFVVATALLHGAGLALGTASRRRLAWAARLGGAGVAAAGAVLLIAG